jgi:hypothetical protein
VNISSAQGLHEFLLVGELVFFLHCLLLFGCGLLDGDDYVYGFIAVS